MPMLCGSQMWYDHPASTNASGTFQHPCFPPPAGAGQGGGHPPGSARLWRASHLHQRTPAGDASRPQRGRGRVGAIPLRVRLRRAPPSASRPQCQSRLENLGDTSAITVRPLGERMLFSAGYSRLLATSVDVTGVYKGDLILSPPAYSFYPHPHQPDPYHRAGCPWYNAENRRP